MDLVELYKYDESKTTMDDYGDRIPVIPDFIKTLKGNIQPYSNELLLKNYGYDIHCTNIFYYRRIDNEIMIGYFLKYKNEWYKIIKVISWKKHMEVMVEKWDSQLT